MAITSIVGGQWGDEGKGKIVDYLSSNVEIVARYQGGANAGHTVFIGEQKLILHQIPSGILRSNCQCLLGNGMVFDPVGFSDELDSLKSNSIDTGGRLHLSYYTHIVTPIHKAIDRCQEAASGHRIGTTGRGIGPTYSDKTNRIGIRGHDLQDSSLLKTKIADRIRLALDSGDITPKEVPVIESQLPAFYSAAQLASGYLDDVFSIVQENIKTGRNILIEGAQGAMLDLDHGTYPFVTSSNPTIGGVSTGLGLPTTAIDRRIGIFKAYTTRVGNGPFPTELKNEDGARLQHLGHEFGATTGRERRCGWFDAVLARYSSQVNGLTEIALTKIDVLDEFEEIKVCTGYKKPDGTITQKMSEVLYRLEDVTPVYETLPGWKENTSDIEHYDVLPERAKQYCQFITELTDTPVKIVSTGPERNQIIVKPEV